MAEYEDMEITCIEAGCGRTFIFEAGEQKFYAEKGFTPPKRCKPCRDERKAQRNGGGGGSRPPRRDSHPQHADDFNSPSFGDVWEGDQRTRRRRRRR
jgi:hypothetical protein